MLTAKSKSAFGHRNARGYGVLILPVEGGKQYLSLHPALRVVVGEQAVAQIFHNEQGMNVAIFSDNGTAPSFFKMDLERFECAYLSALNGAIEDCTDMSVTTIVQSSEPAILSAASAGAKIGDLMSDGTIYAGVSPVTGKAFYTTPFDEPTRAGFDKAASHAKNETRYGYKDWRLPHPTELRHLFQNKDKGALKGTFNESGEDPMGYYWDAEAKSLNFKNGKVAQHPNKKSNDSIRLIRRI